ncbi:MAG: cytochrome c, partial [Chthoniobacterales bacterium]|nr:cytochrome c [Chthoniobacterales bacterium]
PLRDQETGQIVRMESPYKQIHFSTLSDYRNTGKFGERWGTGFPIPITLETLQRGQERYRINCQVCHGPLGFGNGPAYELGLTTVANLHLDRIRAQPDGEIFNTITHGKNTMLGYGSKIQVDDRWAIIAYLRALQLSQNARVSDLAPHEVELLNSQRSREASPSDNQSPAPNSSTEIQPVRDYSSPTASSSTFRSRQPRIMANQPLQSSILVN